MDLMWWGAAIGTVYAVIGYFIGDVFLFSNYQLYSSATNRTEGATPAFFADGREARMVDYVDFHGIDPSRIHWYDFPCSVQWKSRPGKWCTSLSVPRSAVDRLLRVNDRG